MQIDREVVVESEDDASQGIALASALHHSTGTRNQHGSRHPMQIHLLAGLHIPHIVVTCQEIAWVSGMAGHIVKNDAAWHKPFRIDIHSLDMTVEQWGLGLERSAADTHGERILPVYRHQLVSRDIDHNIFLMVPDIVLLSPSAPFHIHQHPVTLSFGKSSPVQLFLEYAVKRIFRLY